MKNSPSLFFLSGPDSHIAYEFPAVGPAIRVSASKSSYQSFGIELCKHDAPLPGWVVCTRNEFQERKALALAFFGLVDQDAHLLAQIEAYEAAELPY